MLELAAAEACEDEAAVTMRAAAAPLEVDADVPTTRWLPQLEVTYILIIYMY